MLLTTNELGVQLCDLWEEANHGNSCSVCEKQSQQDFFKFQYDINNQLRTRNELQLSNLFIDSKILLLVSLILRAVWNKILCYHIFDVSFFPDVNESFINLLFVLDNFRWVSAMHYSCHSLGNFLSKNIQLINCFWHRNYKIKIKTEKKRNFYLNDSVKVCSLESLTEGKYDKS